MMKNVSNQTAKLFSLLIYEEHSEKFVLKIVIFETFKFFAVSRKIEAILRRSGLIRSKGITYERTPAQQPFCRQNKSR